MKKLHKIIKIQNELYILSDKEIKEGWMIALDTNILMNANEKDLKGIKLAKLEHLYKNVIATTDKIQIGNNYGSIELTTGIHDLNDYLPQIPKSFIEEFVKLNGNIKQVNVEYQGRINHKLQGNKYDKMQWELKINSDNEINISLVEDKTYTKEEIMKKLLKLNPQINENSKYTNPFLYQDIKDWYNELKNSN